MTTIQHDGDTWNIAAEGVTRDGKTYCHLVSTTRFRQQRNGKNPVQICDWIDHAGLQQFRSDRSNSPAADAVRAKLGL